MLPSGKVGDGSDDDVGGDDDGSDDNVGGVEKDDDGSDDDDGIGGCRDESRTDNPDLDLRHVFDRNNRKTDLI